MPLATQLHVCLPATLAEWLCLSLQNAFNSGGETDYFNWLVLLLQNMRSLNSRAVYCILRRNYVSATSPQIAQPLNYLNGRREDPENTESFPIAYPATGMPFHC